MSFHPAQDKARWLALAAVVVLGAGCVAWLAVPNDDESWTLMAGNAVWDGRVPYRDFMYTQMPLGPYVLGIPVRLGLPPLSGGRAMMAIFWTGTVIGSAWAAKRFGRWSSVVLVCGTLLIAWPVAREAVLVRGQGLSMCLLALSFAALAKRSDRGDLLAISLAIAAALVRLSYAGPALVILADVILRADAALRRKVIGLGAGLSLPCFLLAVANWPQFVFGLHGFHQLADQDAPGVFARAASWPFRAMIQAPWLPLLIVALAFAYIATSDSALRSWIKVLATSWTAFFIMHLAGHAWHSTYLFGLVPTTVAAIAAPIALRLRAPAGLSRARVAGAIAAAMLLAAGVLVGKDSVGQFKAWGERPEPVDEVSGAASILRRETPAQSSVFALSAAVVALDARRDVRLSPIMGRFAYLPDEQGPPDSADTIDAFRLSEILARDRPEALLLTEQDLFALQHEGTFSSQETAEAVDTVCRSYSPVAVVRRFGEDRKTLSVWVRQLSDFSGTYLGHTTAAASWTKTCRGARQ